MIADLHIHSKYSKDGTEDPKNIIKTAIKKGLDMIAITDHDTIKGGIEAKKIKNNKIEIIVGSEVSTKEGHIIALDINEDIIKNKHTIEVIEDIENKGGLYFLSHPFYKFCRNTINNIRYRSKYKINDIKPKAIEVFNSKYIIKNGNKKAEIYARNKNIGKLSNSDAHIIQEIGLGSSYLSNGIDSIYKAVPYKTEKTPMKYILYEAAKYIHSKLFLR